jgi:osmotically-inducible protein OsmY
MRLPLRTLVALSLLALLAASACLSADDRSPTEEKLKAFLIEKLGDDARGITVTVVKTRATLTGEVKRRCTEELSEEVALAYPGITRVKNDIELERSETMEEAVGGEVGDGALESMVKGLLLDELGRRGFSIEVEAVDGVVSLRGTVPDEARHKLALETAKKADGVKQVIDLVSVAK